MSNIVERLRSPANVFYEYAADNGAFLREAADEITRLRAENESMRQSLPLWAHKQMAANSALIERLRSDLAAVTEERDALLARLAPVEDEALVEIAVQAGYKAEYEADMSVGQAEPIFVEAIYKPLSIYKPIMIAAIAAIRPHIEAAERERCAKITDSSMLPCDIGGDLILDRYTADTIAAAIRRGK